MRNKRAISLIVLVITIIVMAILAATVIITLSNTNIISQANKAVNDATIAQIKEIANTARATYMMDPENNYSTSGSGEFVKDAIKKSTGLEDEDLIKKGIHITNDGEISVIEEEKAVSTYYYSSLDNAVNAVNNVATTALASDEGTTVDSAFASVSVSDSGTYTVKVLKDFELASKILITNSMVLDLNGKNINGTSKSSRVQVDSSTADVVIKGNGGKMSFKYPDSEVTNVDSVSSGISIKQCKSFTIFGGTYEYVKKGAFVTVYINNVNTGNIKVYDANVNSTSTGAVTKTTAIPTGIAIMGGSAVIENCNVNSVGYNAAYGILIYSNTQTKLNNNTVLASAAYSDANIYSDEQTYGIALNAYGPIEVNGGFYSSEVMAASFKREGGAKINGTTFESCDHGVYFSSESTTIRNSNLVFKKWSELECAKLTFPESVIAGGKKTQYSETHKDLCNKAIFYVGSSNLSAKVYMDNCKIIGAKGVISSNYSYLDAYLYVSNTNFENGLRIDRNFSTGYMGHVYMGKGAICPSDKITYRALSYLTESGTREEISFTEYDSEKTGLYDTTTYANTTF